ncbi:MAG: polysaccharide biosynthesis protein-like protein [Rhodospirillales bacterium]|nr:polysaccharide biosynthesis protein-like protein [Rhodospirillales bacterium]
MRVMRRVWRALEISHAAVADRLSWYASWRHLRSNYVTARWEGGKPLANAPKIAVLVHFSTQKRFADYFLYLLRALDQAGFTTVVVSNSRKLDPESLQTVLPWCGRVLQRRNLGYDFGAWRDGILLTPEIGEAEQVLILNDSIFGPLQDLKEIIDQCQFDRTDVWGMTDSYDNKYHLQSFFVLFGAKALRSKAFTDFWRQMRYVGGKRVVIHKYEVGLSQAMLKAGLKLKALYPYRRLSAAVVDRAMAETISHPLLDTYFDRLLEGVNLGRPLNPTHYFWEYLITELRFPFIKRELLEKNPAGIPLLVNWRSTIESTSDYPVELIEDYLQTAARNRVF